MRLSVRPFTPPSLQVLIAGEDGTTAARLLSDERIRAVAEAQGRRAGLAEGLAQGRAESLVAARATATQEMQAEMARLGLQGAAAAAEALQTLFAWREADRRELDADLRAALVAGLQAVLPSLLAQAAGGEVAALLAQALTERAADTITLRAHPTTLEAMRREGCPGPGQAHRLRLLPDANMPEGHAEAAWVDGGLHYDPAALVARVLAVLGGAAPAAWSAGPGLPLAASAQPGIPPVSLAAAPPVPAPPVLAAPPLARAEAAWPPGEPPAPDDDPAQPAPASPAAGSAVTPRAGPAEAAPGPAGPD